ncbi:hypothetical protein SBRCBS47491_004952 [Sporothrix bragantina]|uniref:Uncharacterized protein n=1 Tax=Sporothrix bragantina TaxID=671064 RepID=A0ABP0BUN0_9PEZI
MSCDGGYVTRSKLLQGPDARLATVAPKHDYKELQDRIPPLYLGKTFAGMAHGDRADQRDLRDGKAHGRKYVLRIAEMEGL